MNKHLLLALIAIPLIAGCSANASSGSQSNVSLTLYTFSAEDCGLNELGEYRFSRSIPEGAMRLPFDDGMGDVWTGSEALLYCDSDSCTIRTFPTTNPDYCEPRSDGDYPKALIVH
jgi:hypothetical protein